jgi:hypothetical protein
MIWPQALERGAKACLRVRRWMACVGHCPVVIRAIDHAWLQSICVWEHMRVASCALEWMRGTHRNEAYVAVYSCAEDKAQLARHKAIREELGHTAVDRVLKMVLMVVRHVVVRR